MHKAINIKHRIVRRVDIEIAPLATFDTIDLGDDDIQPSKICLNEQESLQEQQLSSRNLLEEKQPLCIGSNVNSEDFSEDGGLKTGIIGGNTSKKSLSQAGGEKGQRDTSGQADPPALNTEKDVDNKNELVPDSIVTTTHDQAARQLSHHDTQVGHDLGGSKLSSKSASEHKLPPERQGSLGHVTIPVRHPDSDSSSSSSESYSENTVTFQATRSSAVHVEQQHSRQSVEHKEVEVEFDKHDNLLPENIDPSQILSPSKRKAFERRIERLKVTTSPIARPRSTTPINVVTLEEYAAISSPDASPASPSVLQDRLKITLPADEFTAKPKTPKHSSAKRRSSEETIFHFSEESLFSRTKSALVVEEDGLNPLSPRRVLIPPSLTPSSSPQLSNTPRFSKPPGPESIPPTLSLLQKKEASLNFFGETVDETEEENWASFPEPSPTIEAPPSSLSLGFGEEIKSPFSHAWENPAKVQGEREADEETTGSAPVSDWVEIETDKTSADVPAKSAVENLVLVDVQIWPETLKTIQPVHPCVEVKYSHEAKSYLSHQNEVSPAPTSRECEETKSVHSTEPKEIVFKSETSDTDCYVSNTSHSTVADLRPVTCDYSESLGGSSKVCDGSYIDTQVDKNFDCLTDLPDLTDAIANTAVSVSTTQYGDLTLCPKQSDGTSTARSDNIESASEIPAYIATSLPCPIDDPEEKFDAKCQSDLPMSEPQSDAKPAQQAALSVSPETAVNLCAEMLILTDSTPSYFHQKTRSEAQYLQESSFGPLPVEHKGSLQKRSQETLIVRTGEDFTAAATSESIDPASHSLPVSNINNPPDLNLPILPELEPHTSSQVYPSFSGLSLSTNPFASPGSDIASSGFGPGSGRTSTNPFLTNTNPFLESTDAFSSEDIPTGSADLIDFSASLKQSSA